MRRVVTGEELAQLYNPDPFAMPRWRAPEEVLRRAGLAVAERSGADREDVERALAGLDGAGRVTFFEMPRVDASSSAIRGRLRKGASVAGLLPEPVARYIEERGLYGSGVAAR